MWHGEEFDLWQFPKDHNMTPIILAEGQFFFLK